MLLIIAVVLFFTSLIVIFLNKNKESLLIGLLSISLLIFFMGLMLFIAKKGGYPTSIMNFLYCHPKIRHFMQYLYINLKTMGYIIALGRFLFPAILCIIAFNYTRIKSFHNKYIYLSILPLLVLLIIYFPSVYNKFIYYKYSGMLANISYAVVFFYVIAADTLLVLELIATKRKLFKRQFAPIVIFLLSSSLLYLIYCGQDPAQAYRSYSIVYGLGYLKFNINITSFWIIAILSIISAMLGFSSLIRYTGEIRPWQNEEVVFEKRFSITRSSISIFVHGIKNQLLANRVLIRRMDSELKKENPNIDMLKNCISSLHYNNEGILNRAENIYKSVKHRATRLVSIRLDTICQNASKQLMAKFPEAKLIEVYHERPYVLADELRLGEAMVNLLSNAWESHIIAGKTNSPIYLKLYIHHGIIIVEIKDEGLGISTNQQKKIFEPFYSSKNSAYNWGMGLWSARNTVRAHGGNIKLDSKLGYGSAFYIILPILQKQEDKHEKN